MIRSLVLERFGRFIDARFDLGPVTIFCGPNESGKSTLADALFQELCRPPKSSKAGRLLHERYGEHREARLEFDESGSLSFEPGEYMNLLSIRAGDLQVALPSNGDWVSRVKSQLFSGGVDPDRIAAELEIAARDKGAHRHVREWRSLLERREELESRLTDLKRRREEILGRQARLTTTEKGLTRLLARRKELEQDIEAAERKLAQQNLIRQRRQYMGLLEVLETLEARRRRRADLDRVARDETQRLEGIEGSLGEDRRREGALESALAALTEEERLCADRCERLTGESEQASRRSEAARAVRGDLEQGTPTPSRRLRPLWLLAVAAPAAIGAVLGGLLPLPPGAGVVLAALSVAASILIGLLARSWAFAEDCSPVDLALQRAQARLTELGGPALSAGSIPELVAALARLEAEGESAAERRRECESELARLRDRAAEIASSLSAARDSAGKRAAEREQFLAEHGVRSPEEYRRDRAARVRLEEEVREAEARLAKAMERLGCAGEAALRAEVSLRVHNLEAEITQRELPEAEIRVEENRAKRLREQQKTLEEELRRRNRVVDEERGAVRATLGDLPERILAVEREIAVCRERIEAMERDRAAAARAAEIFREISADSLVVLEQLGTEIGQVYGELVGGDRAPQLANLDPNTATVRDAGGVSRPLEALSTGTRDAFLLAARLTLASRAAEGEALIVLDEPFHSLDERRSAAALGVVRDFQQRTGWQILLFTKDAGLAAQAREVFEDPVEHRLAHAPASKIAARAGRV